MVFNNYFGSRAELLCKSGIVALAACLAGGCKDEALYSALDEQQANLVHAALLDVGLEARKMQSEKKEGWVISVPETQVSQAMAILGEAGLPKVTAPDMGAVFEKKGFVSSPLEEKARYIHALSRELAQTLMDIDGVALARVHVALPDQKLLSDDQESASVSVVIHQKPGHDLRRHETDIKAIVTDGVEGMTDVNRVTVKFFDRVAHPVPAVPPRQDPAWYQSSALLFFALPFLLLISVGGGWWYRSRRIVQKDRDIVLSGARGHV